MNRHALIFKIKSHEFLMEGFRVVHQSLAAWWVWNSQGRTRKVSGHSRPLWNLKRNTSKTQRNQNENKPKTEEEGEMMSRKRQVFIHPHNLFQASTKSKAFGKFYNACICAWKVAQITPFPFTKGIGIALFPCFWTGVFVQVRCFGTKYQCINLFP